MASKGSTGSKPKRRQKPSPTSTSILEMSSGGFKEEIRKGRKPGKKKVVRSHSEGTLPTSLIPHHKSNQSTGEEQKEKAESEHTSRQEESGDSLSLGQGLTESRQSSTSNVPVPLVTPSEDEGINMNSPRSSVNSAYSDTSASSDFKAKRMPNSHSKTSSTSSFCTSILEDQEEPEDYLDASASSNFKVKRMPNSHSKTSSTSSFCTGILEDQEEPEDYSDESDASEDVNSSTTLQENDPSAKNSIFIAPTLRLKQQLIDSDSEATPTSTPPPSCAGEKQLQIPPKMFPAQHSEVLAGDISPFNHAEPQQETTERSGLYAGNFSQVLSSDEDIAESEKKRLKDYNDIRREAVVAMVRDNFDRVQHECDKLVEHYQTKVSALKKEHKRLKEQHEAEKEILSRQIQKEREEREKESTIKCKLASELEKYREEVVKLLQNDTKEFQQIKDKIGTLRESLTEKQNELDKLRTTMEERSEQLRSIMPPLQAEPEQIDQMNQSEECLTFLLRLRPDKKTIEEEVRRYQYRTQRRPLTK